MPGLIGAVYVAPDQQGTTDVHATIRNEKTAAGLAKNALVYACLRWQRTKDLQILLDLVSHLTTAQHLCPFNSRPGHAGCADCFCHVSTQAAATAG
jgi:hypothetical protein